MQISIRQIISIILLIVIVMVIAAPSIPTTTLSIEITGKSIEELEHLYVNIEQLKIHQLGARENSGLIFLKEPVIVDLAKDGSSSIAEINRSLPSGQYDKIILHIHNVTIISDNGTVSAVTTQRIISAPLQLNQRFGDRTTLQLTLEYDESALLDRYEFRGTIAATELK